MKAASHTLSRRDFLRGAAVGAGSIVAGTVGGKAREHERNAPGAKRQHEIGRILVQRSRGRRKTPVAPNAYAGYRGYEVGEKLLRIQTRDGLDGITELYADAEEKKPLLKQLIGMDPFELFDWEGDRIRGANPDRKELVDQLYGIDIALLDLMGKVLQKPVADLLGERVRDSVPAYDSSLYMEDLLTPEQREGLVYLDGSAPERPAEMVARKAAWLLEQPHGIRIFKVKIGRAKWMESFEAALKRDIEVMRTLRETVGDEVTLFVDGNHGYNQNPEAVEHFLSETADLDLYAMEEMFDHRKIAAYKDLKRATHRIAPATKLADGEVGGIPEKLLAERVDGPTGPVPVFAINQPDMNWHGYLRLREIARISRKHGLTVAPHNFGSEIGLYAQAHLGLVTPNWEFCEGDDSRFPAIEAPGIQLGGGRMTLTGEPGLGVLARPSDLEETLYELK